MSTYLKLCILQNQIHSTHLLKYRFNITVLGEDNFDDEGRDSIPHPPSNATVIVVVVVLIIVLSVSTGGLVFYLRSRQLYCFKPDTSGTYVYVFSGVASCFH